MTLTCNKPGTDSSDEVADQYKWYIGQTKQDSVVSKTYTITGADKVKANNGEYSCKYTSGSGLSTKSNAETVKFHCKLFFKYIPSKNIKNKHCFFVL